MNKAHVIKLKPTKSQEIFFRKSCGVARFAYNWALNKSQENYKDGNEFMSGYDLRKSFNAIKRKDFKWVQETGKCAPDYAILNLGTAFTKFLKGINKYPRFKKKGSKDSFVAIENKEKYKQKDFKIWVPRLGWVKCCENLRFEGKVNNVRIKRVANMWFACINIEIEDKPIEAPVVSENQTTVGVDMGIKTMLVLSDGTTYENPRALKSNLKHLNRLNRSLSRKQNGSNNQKKAKVKLARKYYKVSCIRKNAIHQATTEIVNKYDKIVIETLKPANMIKNHNLAQAIGDVSFGEIARQLAYKAQWAGKELVKADQWFASSKICSSCGNKKEKLTLGQRTYKCDNCGLEIDRDLNAAINLANYSPTSELEGSEVCGERMVETQSASVKQKVENVFINKIEICL